MGIKEELYELPPAKCFLIGLVFCAAYYFIFFDKGDQFVEMITRTQAEVNNKTERLAEVQKTVADKNSFKQKVKDLENDFLEILKFFPVNMNMNDVQKEISGLLSQRELKVDSVKEVAVQNRFTGYIENGVDLEAIADFHQVMSFLADITKLNKVVDFRSMDFISEQATPENTKIRLKMQFSIFMQDPNAKKADPANPNGGGK